ncbi:MAG: 4-alpha-glucanotransferase [Clostridiales bacterium]|jgi:4-alpha-glucanotransferase|nr:4-alpha-glucanotransferase [Clostridiales bacterium]
MFDKRASGILVHPTSFPSEYGIGDFGPSAYEFINFLRDSNQKVWQILPLTPTSSGNSPYSSFSAFAGNPLLISPDILVNKGLLSKSDVSHEYFNDRKVEYGKVNKFKSKIFRIAFNNFKKAANPDFENFCSENKYWLDSYCLFISIKEYFISQRKISLDQNDFQAFESKFKNKLKPQEISSYYYGGAWISWPGSLPKCAAASLDIYSGILSEEIYYHKFLQYEFFGQWQKLKLYANNNGVRVIGDLPIFVAYDSCDVWANKNLFKLGPDALPLKVAGVPPDYFSSTGQLWGNPVYDWEANKKESYKWWLQRAAHNFKLADILRIDHFRGFDSYWEVPFGNETALDGMWAKGPKHDFFKALKSELGDKEIIAEDLGLLTPDVEKLRSDLGFPGMKILQFAFGYDKQNSYLPHNLKEANSVIYTGTHDNDTTRGWYNTADPEAKHHYRKYLNVSGENVSWDFIRIAFNSIANLAVIPIQDIMSLGEEDRMNTPGVPFGNWCFRYTKEMLYDNYDYYAQGLKELNECFNRNIFV